MRKILLFILLLNLPLSAQAIEICKTIPETLEISAVYPAPLEGEEEWIELRNTGSDSIDLSYFTIEDATAKPMSLSGTLAGKDSTKISKPSFQLNNGTDTVTLRISDGTLIDTWTYEGGIKGEITYRNQSSSSSSTSSSSDQEVELAEETQQISAIWPVFSEALPNPEGSDTTEEWIELYNPYDEAINLTGFKLDDSDGGSSPYKLTETIPAKAYLLISVEDSKLSLNNSVDSIRLLSSNDTVLWEVAYDGPKEGWAYAVFDGDYYTWTATPTPGFANEYLSTTEESTESPYQNGDLSEDLEISEVYPNPDGPDAEEEWIEITNGGDTAVNLGNWTVDDGEGGSDPYVFPDDTIIEPGESIVLYRTESGVALNNSDEIVQLNDYTGETVDEVSYENSVEGESYAEIEIEEMESTVASTSGLGSRIFETWQWSAPSPGEKNPKWKQFKGKVTNFQDGILSLFDGASTWEFKADSSSLDTFLFQTGNLVLVQAMLDGEFLTIKHSELLENAPTETRRNMPWGLIGTGLLTVAWIGYEIYKKHHKKLVAF